MIRLWLFVLNKKCDSFEIVVSCISIKTHETRNDSNRKTKHTKNEQTRKQWTFYCALIQVVCIAICNASYITLHFGTSLSHLETLLIVPFNSTFEHISNLDTKFMLSNCLNFDHNFISNFLFNDKSRIFMLINKKYIREKHKEILIHDINTINVKTRL